MLKLDLLHETSVISFGFWVVPIDHWDKIPIILCTNTKQSPTIFYCCSFYIIILKTKLYIFFYKPDIIVFSDFDSSMIQHQH